MKVKISKKTAKKICKANRLIAQCCKVWYLKHGCNECPLNDQPICRVFTGSTTCLEKTIIPEDLVGEYEIMEDKKDENNK